MSAIAARFFFAFVIVLNFLLWSNSRYGQTLVAKSIHAHEGNLVRRISYELMHPGEVRMSEDEVRYVHITLGL